MSATADALLAQLRQLPLVEQQEIVRELLRSLRPELSHPPRKPFPSVRVRGGTITSEQVAEALEDE